MIKCCILLVFASLLCFGIAGKLPSTFEVCKRNDPELGDCFTKAVQHALPYFKEPIAELGLPSMEPALIEKIVLAPGSSSSVNVTHTLHNLKIYNLIDAIINKSEITLGTKDFKTVVYTYQKITKMEYEYEVEGNVILVPIVGKGDAHIEFADVQGAITMSGVFHDKKGKTYMKIDHLSVDINPGKVKMQLDNLFNGNERLGNEMNKLLNENGKEIIDELKPGITEALGVYYKSIFGVVFDKVSYDELFPL